MKTKVNKPSRLQAFLYKHIEASTMNQKDMAEQVGYTNPNMITILKQGDAKLPLDRVVPMAKVLNVDPKELMSYALEAYYGYDAANQILSVFGARKLPVEQPAPDQETAD